MIYYTVFLTVFSLYYIGIGTGTRGAARNASRLSTQGGLAARQLYCALMIWRAIISISSVTPAIRPFRERAFTVPAAMASI